MRVGLKQVLGAQEFSDTNKMYYCYKPPRIFLLLRNRVQVITSRKEAARGKLAGF